MKKAIVPVLFPGAALAHPGHGAGGEAHWLTQPDHLAVVVLLVALAALAALAARPLWRRRARG